MIIEVSRSARLDKAIVELIPDISRSAIQKAIKNDEVRVNSVIISDPSFKVADGDEITLTLSKPKVQNLEAQNIPLNIVYEDDDLIVINKSSNMTVHPGAGIYSGTLVNALLYHSSSLSSENEDSNRPGIVHRLDKDTSGLMVIAKNNRVHQSLATQIQERTLIRKYFAICWGVMIPSSGIITANIGRSRADRTKMQVTKMGGKTAVTHYNTKSVLKNGLLSFVECKLETGRTHQIRVHLSNKGHSILGDQVYGSNAKKLLQCQEELRAILASIQRQALHSYYIKFFHPIKDKYLEFYSDLPDDMKLILGKMEYNHDQ
jgi:23S rRNA pseudouridine1911/1915/1917 synthase